MRRQTVPDSKPRWLRQMVEPFTDTAGRPDPDPPPDHVAARRTDELHELTGADTAGRGRRTRGHRRGTPTSTPGHWTADAWTSHTRTLDGHTGHRTPDAGHRTRGRDRVRGQGGLDMEGIPDRLPGRSRLPDCPLDAEPWTCGRRRRRSATVGYLPAPDYLPRATRRLLGRSVGQAKPRLGALLSSDDCGSSVERTAKLHPLWRVHEAAGASAV
jgi:hypothetical protein